MAKVRIPDEHRTIEEAEGITACLASRDIEYERLDQQTGNSRQGTSEELLSSYAGKIDELKARGGYVAADVIDVNPATPGLEAMLARFNSEHWHDEDEVRLIVEGRGLFHIHPPDGPVLAIEGEPGDLVR